MTASEILGAARVLHATGLVDAFGHVSHRTGDQIQITSARPLSDPAQRPIAIDAGADTLPDGAPKEAWIHLAIYEARPDVSAVCRAQPESVLAACAAGVTIRALHGQGSFAGTEVPVFDDARLVRDRERGRAVAAALGEAPAVALRGNGAVTVAASPGLAAARMYVLEASARINLRAAACTDEPHRLSDAETQFWRDAEPEILSRLWEHLARR